MRYFKVAIDGGDPHGRFSGTRPKQAAYKALTHIIREKEKNNTISKGKFRFSMIECTKGSKHKTYDYVGERIELDEPVEVVIGCGDNQKIIQFKSDNNITSIKNNKSLNHKSVPLEENKLENDINENEIIDLFI